MSHRIELYDEEIALLLQALEDAITYRDARLHVVQSAVRRRDRRLQVGSGRESDAGGAHRKMVRDYEQIALKLRNRSN